MPRHREVHISPTLPFPGPSLLASSPGQLGLLDLPTLNWPHHVSVLTIPNSVIMASNDNQMTRFLFAILKQKSLKDVSVRNQPSPSWVLTLLGRLTGTKSPTIRS